MLQLKTLTFVLTLALTPPPTLTVNSLKPLPFHVTYAADSVQTCLRFRSHVEKIELNGVVDWYSPSKCYATNGTAGSFDEGWEFIDANNGDWDVWGMSVYFPETGSELVTAESAHVVVRH